MKSDTFKPLRDNLLVLPDPEATTTSGGILLPDKRKAPPAKVGTVVRVGPGLLAADGMAASAGIKTGDKVAYPTFFGHELVLEDGTFRVLSEREVLGHFGSTVRPSLPLEPVKRVTVDIAEETPAFPVED